MSQRHTKVYRQCRKLVQYETGINNRPYTNHAPQTLRYLYGSPESRPATSSPGQGGVHSIYIDIPGRAWLEFKHHCKRKEPR